MPSGTIRGEKTLRPPPLPLGMRSPQALPSNPATAVNTGDLRQPAFHGVQTPAMRYSPFRLFLCAVLGPTLAATLPAALVTYPAPGYDLLSSRYTVSVAQSGAARDSFVYESTNPFVGVHNPMGEANHWTTFSFDGTVEVTVTLPTNTALLSARVLPTAHDIPCRVNRDRRTVTFTLDQPRQLAVEINGDRRQPLFIFAKELESDLPDFAAANVIDFSQKPTVHNDPDRPNVLYFPPGVYDLVELGYNLHDGFPLDEGDTVYIAGGAVVYGAFSATGPKVTVRGRGVISGAKWMWVRRRYEEAGIPWSYHAYREIAVYLHGGGGNLVEGVTFTDPVHFCVSVDDDSTVRGIQAFGWWYTTDGVFAGERSVVEDSFFKVNDDIVKVYANDLIVRRCLIWQQTNGAPFQLTWNLKKPVSGVRVNDIIIMASEVSRDRELEGNRAVVNARLNMGAAISDFVFDGIRIEGDIYRVLGLNIGQAGSIADITLRNIEVTGRITHFNYLNATGGTIDNIHLENITIAGQPARSLDDFIIVTRGDVGDVTIE